MQATVVNFRRGRKTMTPNQMIVVTDVKDAKSAEKYIGKEAVWNSPAKKEIKGKVAAVHGGNGAVRIIFETGMPGQAIGQKIEIKV